MKYYHIWFQTKKRKRLLDGEIDNYVHTLFNYVAEEKGIWLVAFETMLDHAHLLLALKGAADLPLAVKLFKGISARRIFQEFPILKQQIKSNNFWAKKYGSKEIPKEKIGQVIDYIYKQKINLHILFPTFQCGESEHSKR